MGVPGTMANNGHVCVCYVQWPFVTCMAILCTSSPAPLGMCTFQLSVGLNVCLHYFWWPRDFNSQWLTLESIKV